MILLTVAEVLGTLSYPDSFLDCTDVTTPFGKSFMLVHISGFKNLLVCLKFHRIYSSPDFGREGGGDKVKNPGVLPPALTLLLYCQSGLLQPDIKWLCFNIFLVYDWYSK